MPDDLTKRHPQDASRINLGQQWEVAFWVEKLHTTEAKLRDAVSKVGGSVSAVKDYLKKSY